MCNDVAKCKLIPTTRCKAVQKEKCKNVPKPLPKQEVRNRCLPFSSRYGYDENKDLDCSKASPEELTVLSSIFPQVKVK